MWKLQLSGTKATLKITPKYPLETVRKLDNVNRERGADNKPHYHLNIGKMWKRIQEKKNG